MLTAFDLLLITIAIVVMAAGFKNRWAVVQLGRPQRPSRDPVGLIKYLCGHDKIMQNRKAGWAHLFVFFGVLVPLLVIILAQFDFAMPLPIARLLSLLTELIGLAMLAGLLYFLLRRIGATAPRAPQRTIFPVAVLLLIVVTGFLAEGTRLAIISTGFSWSSPAGWLLSLALPDSPLLMQVLIRLHFFALLVFVAALPFTFMRHLIAGSLNVYYRRQGLPGAIALPTPELETTGAGTIKDFSLKQLLEAEACVSCGRCEVNCPASQAEKPLSPRKVMQDILSQMEQANRNGCRLPAEGMPLLEEVISADEIWSCTSCMACVTHCPVFIEPLDKIIDLRRHKVMGQGLLPVEARSMIRDLELYRDVYGRGISHRADWALNRAVPLISEDSAKVDVLFWVGCSGAFHPRYQQAAQEMVRILQAAAVKFAILGNAEYCCGDPARRLGDDSVFIELAQRNIRQLKRHGVQRILTLCPHCYSTLKNEYPSLGADFEVEHASQFIARLIQRKRIQLQYPLEQTLTVHDPCFLGRANQIYEPLRQICQAVPGLRIKELQRNRESAFCCGGGGGKMWLHDSAGHHINQMRAEEIALCGADWVATACPYCVTMLEDGIAALEIEKPPKVKDIVEVVASSLAV
ncbi:Fe-S oxidoreductase [Olavius sp. associated proteobacterium Delta 1]|nr:Fe-S oxidoreductase [Olavius sp. associated proteobacterium Delta 1]